MTTRMLTLTSPFCISLSIWSMPGSSTWDWSRGNGKLWMASCQLCQVGTRVFSSLFWSNWRLELRIAHLLRIELRSTLLGTSYEGGASWKTSPKSPPSGFPTPAKFKPMKLPRSGRSEALQASIPPLPSQLRITITPGSGEKWTLLSRAARKRG